MTLRGPRSEPVAPVAPAADPVVRGLVCAATALRRAIVWRRKLFEFVASRRMRGAGSSNWSARQPIYSAQQRRLNGARWTKSPAATDAESRLVVAAMLVQAKCTTRPCYAKAIPRSTQTWISHTSIARPSISPSRAARRQARASAPHGAVCSSLSQYGYAFSLFPLFSFFSRASDE